MGHAVRSIPPHPTYSSPDRLGQQLWPAMVEGCIILRRQPDKEQTILTVRQHAVLSGDTYRRVLRGDNVGDPDAVQQAQQPHWIVYLEVPWRTARHEQVPRGQRGGQ